MLGSTIGTLGVSLEPLVDAVLVKDVETDDDSDIIFAREFTQADGALGLELGFCLRLLILV